MIYYNNKPIGFINHEKPYKNIPKLVYTETDMTELLSSTNYDDQWKIVQYTGPSTSEYSHNSYYILTVPIPITITTYGDYTYKVYDGQSNNDTLLTTLSGIYGSREDEVVCTSGFLYFEMVDEDEVFNRCIHYTPFNSTVSINGGTRCKNWTIKVNEPGSVSVSTDYNNAYYSVTLQATISEGSLPVYIYDGANKEEGRYAGSVGGPLGTDDINIPVIDEKSVRCTSGRLYLLTEGVWYSSPIAHKGTFEIIETGDNFCLIEVQSDGRLSMIAKASETE